VTRAEKVKEAQSLRDGGLLDREIAERFGVTRSAVTKWLNPNRKEWERTQNAKRGPAKRAWAQANRAACPSCGKPMREGSRSPSHRSKSCRDCEHHRRRQPYLERGKQIEGWWNEGLTYPQLQARLGWTKSRLAVEIHRLRRDGFDLPYRRQHHKHKPKFPDQVAA
jgi:transposase